MNLPILAIFLPLSLLAFGELISFASNIAIYPKADEKAAELAEDITDLYSRLQILDDRLMLLERACVADPSKFVSASFAQTLSWSAFALKLDLDRRKLLSLDLRPIECPGPEMKLALCTKAQRWTLPSSGTLCWFENDVAGFKVQKSIGGLEWSFFHSSWSYP